MASGRPDYAEIWHKVVITNNYPIMEPASFLRRVLGNQYDNIDEVKQQVYLKLSRQSSEDIPDDERVNKVWNNVREALNNDGMGELVQAFQNEL